MTEIEIAPAPSQGLFARVVGIVVSPRATFEGIVKAPRPAGILFVAALVIGLAQGLPQFTERGRQAAIDMNVQTMERFSGRPVDEAAMARIETQAKFGPYTTMAGAIVGVPIMSVIFAAIYWVIFNTILGGTASLKQVLTVVAHSQVITALGAVIGAPIQYAKGTMQMSGPFNLGALVPFMDENSFLTRLLSATSVFTLWGLAITGIGLGVLYRRSGRNIGIALIVVYLVIAGALIGVFSSFSGR